MTPDSPTPQAAPDAGRGTRIGTLAVVVLIVVSLLLYFIGDRLTPHTSQARFQAFVVPVAAEVPGKVLKVHVRKSDLSAGSRVAPSARMGPPHGRRRTQDE